MRANFQEGRCVDGRGRLDRFRRRRRQRRFRSGRERGDDTGNGNAGSKIQAYQCLSDLADYFVRTSSGQFVHNGDCLDVSGNRVVLAACIANKASQGWAQTQVDGTLRNQSTNTCLTASSPKDFTQLSVAACGNASNQKWHVPNVSA